MARILEITCSACSFPPRAIVLGAADNNYVCSTCSDIVQFTPTPLRVTALECPQCRGSLVGAALVGRDKPLNCPSCHTGTLVVREKMHILINPKTPDVRPGDVVHGQIIKRGRHFQLELYLEPNLRGRFSLQPNEEQVGTYVEATVTEVGRKTLVLECVKPLASGLLASAGL